MEASSNPAQSLALLAPVTRSWQRVMALPKRTRTALFAVTAGVIFSAGIFASLVMQPSWRVLYAHLDPADARELGDELTTAKIPFDVTPEGTTIKVPADQLDKARLETAAKGGPKSGRLGFELFDKPNWVGSEFDERVNYQRALEGELEHTIESLASVKSAHVHLVLPHESLFTERQEEAKASVLLKLRQRDLSPQEVDAIRNLVASAVDHLSPANVTLVDADGRAQLGARNPDAAASEEEQRLDDRLIATLEPVTGEGNVRASVHLEYDNTAADETDETYDPNGTVTLSMQRSEQQTGEKPTVGGVPGTVSNAPNAQPPLLPPPHSAAAASMKEESGTYGASKKTRHIVEGPGKLKRATIAVLINDRREGHGTMSAQVPWTPDQMKRITELAQATAGYDAARGDVISVENISFDSAPEIGESVAARALNTAQNLDLPRYGAALIGLLALILLVIRPATRSLRSGALPAPGGLLSVTDALPEEMAHALPTPERNMRDALFQRVSASVAADTAQSARLLHMWLESD
ncbi:MAG TPA: flagellar basal-body MS-ring/collar protein FliF [Acidobacteriaceae bacterium]